MWHINCSAPHYIRDYGLHREEDLRYRRVICCLIHDLLCYLHNLSLLCSHDWVDPQFMFANYRSPSHQEWCRGVHCYSKYIILLLFDRQRLSLLSYFSKLCVNITSANLNRVTATRHIQSMLSYRRVFWLQTNESLMKRRFVRLSLLQNFIFFGSDILDATKRELIDERKEGERDDTFNR